METLNEVVQSILGLHRFTGIRSEATERWLWKYSNPADDPHLL